MRIFSSGIEGNRTIVDLRPSCKIDIKKASTFVQVCLAEHSTLTLNHASLPCLTLEMES
jgi:hypothetical protein